MEALRFVADGMLGRLARWLRLAGFDTAYVNSRQPSDILGLGRREDRFILTRSTYLAEAEPERVFRIHSERVREQLREVWEHFQLPLRPERFGIRCSLCNEILEEVSRDVVKGKVPPYVFQNQSRFYHCRSCGRIYWAGSHFQHITEILKELKLQDNR